MTPNEKAGELYNNMYHELPARMGRHEISKNCALIAVDELIKQQEKYNNGSFYPSNYWTEVKAEIQKF